jgi:PAS domain S-box-containing protein
MRLLRDVPIKRKLAAISQLTSGCALLLACAAFITYEQIGFRRDMTHGLEITARIIGFNGASALSFNDAESAAETLRSLAAQPRVVRACIYDSGGEVFATYRRASEAERPWPVAGPDQAEFRSDALRLFHSIREGEEVTGTLYLESDLQELHQRRWRYIVIAALVLAVAMLVARLISRRLHRIIIGPLGGLAGVAGRVAAEKDYSLRARKEGEDEIGRLIDGFNGMLAQIQTRDSELHAARKDLERRVEERTRELSASEERIRLIVDAAFDAIVAIESSGRITAWNRQACETFGWTSAEAQGRDLVELVVAPPDRDACRQRLLRYLESGDESLLDRRVEIAALHRDGRELSIELAISPVRIDDGVLFSLFLRDITEAKRAEAELRQIHRQLLDTSRRAGMAEVATGVLHNVGNVLNSVNVSATLVSDLVRRSKSPNVAKLRDLFAQHRENLAAFLTSDPKGVLVPAYLGTLADALAKEQGTILSELEHLHKNIGHIKDIVAMQQNYAKTSGVVETVSVPDLVEDALRMNAGSLARHDVDVVREYEGRPVITVEKNKVLQILVNLIRNAKYACDESGRTEKLITVRIRTDQDGVAISVADNGVGIHPDHLTRIFAHGFTTRREGHGFGLHSGALAARELGGSLVACSEGPGKGATFVLALPFNPKSADERDQPATGSVFADDALARARAGSARPAIEQVAILPRGGAAPGRPITVFGHEQEPESP